MAFLLGAPIPLAALGAASFVLITRRVKAERIFRGVDWSLLIFFGGLFVVTGALETSGLSDSVFSVLQPLAEGELAG